MSMARYEFFQTLEKDFPLYVFLSMVLWSKNDLTIENLYFALSLYMYRFLF